MPLHVQCPTGCFIRMSSNRAGRVVRCPECKSAIRIPKIDFVGVTENEVISCIAKIAKRKQSASDKSVASTAPAQNPSQQAIEAPSNKSPVLLPQPETQERLRTPAPASPTQDRLAAQIPSQSETAATESLHLDVPTPNVVSRNTPDPEQVDHSLNIESDRPIHVDTANVPISTYVETNWEQRLESANADRRILARFFAICLCVVAIVNMVPALYHWFHWTQIADNASLPRWIYIQVFVGAVYLIYSMFLAQIPDWSALRSVAIAMLLMAFVFGVVSTGLLVGGGQGSLTGFLGIPYTLNREACIWCVAMLCLATLMSYWGGKESMNWQRAEALLKEILNRSPSQA